MENRYIDINVDVGEGFGNESKLMPLVSSCNIACGGHAGDSKSMRMVVKLAQKYGVKIGAHPSFPDSNNFGRKPLKMTYKALIKSLSKQMNALLSIVEEENATIHHIKPHGALYNLAVTDEGIATSIVQAVKDLKIPVKLYLPYKSVVEKIALQNNLPITYEAFADRQYNDNLTLVSRSEKNALIDDADAMFSHVLFMVNEQKVKTKTGAAIAIKADTFCVHGDTNNADILLKKLHENLRTHGIKVNSFYGLHANI